MIKGRLEGGCGVSAFRRLHVTNVAGAWLHTPTRPHARWTPNYALHTANKGPPANVESVLYMRPRVEGGYPVNSEWQPRLRGNPIARTAIVPRESVYIFGRALPELRLYDIAPASSPTHNALFTASGS